MGKLHGTSVYLAGAVEMVGDENATTWRNEITPILTSMGIEVWDPMIKPQWFPQITGAEQASMKYTLISDSEHEASKADHTNKLIRAACLSLAGQADFIICNMPRQFTAGTFEEIYLANQTGKPILFMSDYPFASMWLHSAFTNNNDWRDVFFPGIHSLMNYISKVDNGTVEIDPIKWIFLTWRREYGNVKSIY